jgi:membrane associated rhomboid family serine protease
MNGDSDGTTDTSEHEPAENLVTVFESRDPAEVELLLAFLEDAGVDAQLMGQVMAASIGAGNSAVRARLDVPCDQEEQARELIGAFFAGAAAAENEELESETLEDPSATRSTDPAWLPMFALVAALGLLLLASSRWPDSTFDLGSILGLPTLPQAYRLVTYAFLHFGAGHLLVNVVALLLCGWLSIRLFGLPRSAMIYSAGALAAGVASAIILGSVRTVGASGAGYALVAAVLVGRLRLALQAPVLRGKRVLVVAGLAMLVLPPVLLFNYAAHLGGLAAGTVLAFLFDLAPLAPDAGFSRRGRALALLAIALMIGPLAWGGVFAYAVRAEDVSDVRCRGGDTEACFRLATEALQRDSADERGRAKLEFACGRGHGAACAALADLIEAGAAKEGEIGRYRARACRHDQKAACTKLGMQMTDGRGVPQNDEAALELFEKACLLGDMEGCFEAGVSYERGRGTDVDRAKAKEHYATACSRGLRAACRDNR